jgi:hypothetical protein
MHDPLTLPVEIATRLARGGASVEENEEEESEDEDYEVDEADEGEESEYDYEDEEDEVGDVEDVQIEVSVQKFDDPFVPSPFTNLYVSIGVMLLARRIDLFHPTVVKIARFAYIAYLVFLQLFLAYVRIQAKQNNDRTPIELTNPLSSVLQQQLGGGAQENGVGNGMMKNLASSLLSSKSTVLEYDLNQTKSMQRGLILNMAFMWFLHFKMEQVQPLIIQTVTGLCNLFYSPLFQIYVLGRNLERPFKNPAMKRMEEQAEEQAAADAAAQQTEETAEEEDTVEAIAEEVEESSEEEEEKEGAEEEDAVAKANEANVEEAAKTVEGDAEPVEEAEDATKLADDEADDNREEGAEDE